jgi:hypothetical protein
MSTSRTANVNRADRIHFLPDHQSVCRHQEADGELQTIDWMC